MFHLQTMPLLRTLLSEAISDVTGHIRAFLLSPHTRPPPPTLFAPIAKQKSPSQLSQFFKVGREAPEVDWESQDGRLRRYKT